MTEVKKMIFVMLSPLFIVGFIALSIYEEKEEKRTKKLKTIKMKIIFNIKLMKKINIKIKQFSATKGVS